MKKAIVGAIVVIMLIVVSGLYAVPDVADGVIPQSPDNVERGRYLVAAGGCVSCHEGTEHPTSLSGGLALESEFGTFYASNITPDPATGIGEWTGADFLRALQHGRSPNGSFYFPAFPYPSYRGMTDEDVLDVAAYLLSLAPVAYDPPGHELPGWLNRWMLAGWQWLNEFTRTEPTGESDPVLARGAYLARNLGHCGECHTPRNDLGMMDLTREFGGARLEDKKVEAIDRNALAEWTEKDVAFLMTLGVKPDGEFVGGKMEQVIEHNTSRLTAEDRQALAAFLKRP